MSSMAWTERDITAMSSKKRDSRLPSDPNSRKASRRLSVSSAGTNRSEATSQQSGLIATLSEFEQQASSWRNSNCSDWSNLKHSENSKATNIENTLERETDQNSSLSSEGCLDPNNKGDGRTDKVCCQSTIPDWVSNSIVRPSSTSTTLRQSGPVIEI